MSVYIREGIIKRSMDEKVELTIADSALVAKILERMWRLFVPRLCEI